MDTKYSASFSFHPALWHCATPLFCFLDGNIRVQHVTELRKHRYFAITSNWFLLPNALSIHAFVIRRSSWGSLSGSLNRASVAKTFVRRPRLSLAARRENEKQSFCSGIDIAQSHGRGEAKAHAKPASICELRGLDVVAKLSVDKSSFRCSTCRGCYVAWKAIGNCRSAIAVCLETVVSRRWIPAGR